MEDFEPNEFWMEYFNSDSSKKTEIIKRLVRQVLLLHLKEDRREERVLAIATAIKSWIDDSDSISKH